MSSHWGQLRVCSCVHFSWKFGSFGSLRPNLRQWSGHELSLSLQFFWYSVSKYFLPSRRDLLISSARRRASRDSTNQNASFVEWFSRLERTFFRGICGEIFALFQACVGNFDTIPPWKVVGTLYLDSSCVTFKYFAFLSVCDKFELLGHVQAAMMIWVLFLPFFLDSLLVTVSSFIELFWPSCYFNLSSLQISGSTRVYPC